MTPLLCGLLLLPLLLLLSTHSCQPAAASPSPPHQPQRVPAVPTSDSTSHAPHLISSILCSTSARQSRSLQSLPAGCSHRLTATPTSNFNRCLRAAVCRYRLPCSSDRCVVSRMSGVNVEFYKAQLLKHADQLDQRLLTNGPSHSHRTTPKPPDSRQTQFCSAASPLAAG